MKLKKRLWIIKPGSGYELFDRIPFGQSQRDIDFLQQNADICGDCGVKQGQIHDYGCDLEECPQCGEQLISCRCRKSYSMF